jgi:hypothetical protein
MQEIATIPQDAASLHCHVPGNLFYPRLVVSDANDRAARLAAIPAGESPADIQKPSPRNGARGRVDLRLPRERRLYKIDHLNEKPAGDASAPA